MFPRYLFINSSDQTDDLRPIRSTIGIANLVKSVQISARVPDNLITALKQREDEEGIQVLPKKELKEGGVIQIVEGPFEGYEAIYQTGTSQDRVVLLLNFAEKYIKLQINEKLIEPIK